MRAGARARVLCSTPKHSADLQGLLRRSDNAADGAWLGLTDRAKILPQMSSGGWQWLDESSLGRDPVNMTVGILKRQPLGDLLDGEVSFLAGYVQRTHTHVLHKHSAAQQIKTAAHNERCCSGRHCPRGPAHVWRCCGS